jgi:acetamidase/formamidase
MPAAHTLRATPDTVHWGFFDGTLPAVLTIDSGDTVTVTTVSGGPDMFPAAGSGMDVLPEHPEIVQRHEKQGPHIMTGPIAVRGAAPGDALEVRIKDIQLRQNWGYTLFRPGGGGLPDDFSAPKVWTIPLDLERRVARLPWGGEMPLVPFFGNIGVAPAVDAGRATSIIPREFGGNLDNKELLPGASIYFPVFNEGGLLSVGDGHGAQGDGELCGTAIETALQGTFEIVLHKGMTLPRPRAETPTHWITMAFDPDLDEASRVAMREMMGLLKDKAGLEPEAAYAFMSLACELRITQVVNRSKGVHAMFPKALLPG